MVNNMEYQSYPQDQHPLRRFIPLAIAAIILIGLLLIILWFFLSREGHNADSKKPSSSSHQSSHSKSSKPDQKKNESANSQNKNNAGSTPSAGTDNSKLPGSDDSGQAEPQNDTDKDLSNTGPGDIFALFIAATILGTGYKYRQLRKSR